MAIKGKKKSKSGRKKPRAAAPKHEVVVPAIPLKSRRWVQFTLVAVVALGMGLGLGYGFGNQSSEDAVIADATSRAKSVAALDEAAVEALDGTGAFTPTTYSPFPDLSAAIEKGDAKAGAKVAKDAEKAAERLTGIDVEAYAAGLTVEDVERAQSSLGLLVQGMELFRQAGAALRSASANPANERAALDLAASADSVSRFAYEQLGRLKVASGAAEEAPDPDQVAQDFLDQQIAGDPTGGVPTVPNQPVPGVPAGP